MILRRVKNSLGIGITVFICGLILAGAVWNLKAIYHHMNGFVYTKNMTNDDSLDAKLEEDIYNKDLGENSYYTGLLMYTGMLECSKEAVSLDKTETSDAITYTDKYLKVLSDMNLLPVDYSTTQPEFATLSTNVVRYSDRVFSKYKSDIISYSTGNIHYNITIDIDIHSKYIYMLKIELKDGGAWLNDYYHRFGNGLTETDFQKYIYSGKDNVNNKELSEFSIRNAIDKNKFEIVQDGKIQEPFYATVTMDKDLFEIKFSP